VNTLAIETRAQRIAEMAALCCTCRMFTAWC